MHPLASSSAEKRPLRFGGLVVVVLGLAGAVVADGSAEDVPGFREEMRSAGFSDSDIANVQAGRMATRLLPQPRDNDAFVVGVSWINGAAKAFVDQIREVGRAGSLRAGPRALQAGRFGTPPGIDDLRPLRIEAEDLQDLSRCRVGDCDVQVSRQTMESARKVESTAPDAANRTAEVLKAALVERVAAYLHNGLPAMQAYDDGNTPQDVASGLAQVFKRSPEVVRSNPGLFAYVMQFPDGNRPPDLEDFVYWSKDKVRKPIVSIVHVFLQRDEVAGETRFFIAMKHIYDSHYFSAYSEFLTLFPHGKAGEGFYLIRSIRALINPPRGFLRGLLLGRIKSAMRDQLAQDLQRTRLLAEASAARTVKP